MFMTFNLVYVAGAIMKASVFFSTPFMWGGFLANNLLILILRYQLQQKSKETLFAVYYHTNTRKLETVYFDRGGVKKLEIDPADVEVIPESLKALREKEFLEAKQELNPTKPDPNSQFEQIEAIYRDSRNGLKWKTVNNGKWYNQNIWLYLLTKKAKGKVDPTQVGQWKEENDNST